MFVRFLREMGVSDAEAWASLADSGLRILLILVIAWLILMAARRLIKVFKRYMERQDTDREQVKRVETLAQVFRYIGTVIVFVVAGMLILSEVGISIAPVLATAGVAGLAIGFGAQSLVKDYFTGFCILVENQIRQGDVVRVANLDGVVEEMTLRYVQLRDFEGNVHYVPNGVITTVTNSSRGYAFAVIDIAVAYAQDVDRVMDVMRELGKEMKQDKDWAPRILDELEMVGIEKLSDTGNILRCRFRTLPLEQWNVKREYLRRIKRRFEERSITTPTPHVTVHAPATTNQQSLQAAAAAAAANNRLS
ncbi:MAG TPA: mechanosensitive ion channel family protein [Burkholderiales bacterium]|nr:mechanosensitive ion channel family protein [Burkholderiales bacterium]